MTILLRAPTADNPSPTGPDTRPYTPRPVTGADPLTGNPTTSPSTLTGTPEQNDARTYINSLLADYGLQSLSGWAWDQIIAGYSPAMIAEALKSRPEFAARFPVWAKLKARGIAMSVAEIVNYENRARELLHQFGTPAGFYDSTDELQDFIDRGWSLAELNDHLNLAANEYYNTDSTVRDQLSTLYGISLTPGQEIAYIMDRDKALPLIQRQLGAAHIAAAAYRTTYGQLTAPEAETLQSQGISETQAQSGFTSLAAQSQLFSPLPGETQDAYISRTQQIAAQFGGNVLAQDRIARAAERRVAEFRGRAQFVETQQGVTALSTSNVG
jgi:hypothetical protein